MDTRVETPKIEIDNRKDVVMLLLHAKGGTKAVNEAISGRTRLMKLVFLFYEEIIDKLVSFNNLGEDNHHKFKAYHYGPFSKDVFDDLQFLENVDMIYEESGGQASMAEVAESRLFYDEALVERLEQEETEALEVEPVFLLTDRGMKFAEELFNNLSGKEKTVLQSFKAKFNGLPLSTLLRYVYSTYPDLAAESKIKDSI